MAEIKRPSPGQWLALPVEEVLRALGSRPAGLTTKEAQSRLEEYGPNELRREAGVSPLALFLRQFQSFLVLLLLGATALSLILGEVLDAVIIFAIVFLSAVLGFLQEYRASQALEALQRMAAPTATVLREGDQQTIPAHELVPGDIVVLATGDRVPADGRLLQEVNLRVDESALTGESAPVDKQTDPVPADSPLADRTNSVFAGTTIVNGRGVAIVVATGMASEFGQIAHLVQSGGDQHTPLERRMAEIGRRLGTAAIAVVAVVAVLGTVRGGRLLDMFLWGVSLAVAAVPEALPAVVTGALTIGVQRMARRNAIIRRLPAVETLGSVTTICSDKTGTLTRNQMTVRRLWLGGRWVEVTGLGYEPRGEFGVDGSALEPGPALQQLAKASVLCNDAELKRAEDGQSDAIIGDPTEGALLVMAAKAGLEPHTVRAHYPRLAEIPFDSVRKRMSTIHRTPEGDLLLCAKGAPEVLLSRCSQYLSPDGQTRALGPEMRQQVLTAAGAMAEEALRVLAVAHRPLPEIAPEPDEEAVEHDLVLVGLVGELDPPREEVKGAIRSGEEAGVRSVMITGDHPATATAVARELSLLKPDSLVLSGSELDRLSDDELTALADRAAVYARVSPEHKLRVVNALQRRGQFVAMTGDGINDAPAVKTADIGIAMGITGTDVTKEAADMVLADDDYVTIVAAVREGRVIYDNIRKVLRYLLSTNSGEILTMFVAVVIGLPIPLLAIQILWVNLVTDGLPALALGVEPAEREVMRRPPRDPRESLFARGLWQSIVWVGLLMAAGSLSVMVWGMANESLETARTLTFLTLSAFQLFNVLAIRSERESTFSLGLLSNPYLFAAVALAFALQFAVIYLPFLQEAFDTTPLNGLQIAVCLLVASTAFWGTEVEKWLRRRRAVHEG